MKERDMKNSDRRMAQSRILDVVRSVRWRWRARIFLSGLTWVGAITGAVLFLSAVGLEQMRFSAGAVVWLRSLTWGTFALTSFWFVLRPLLRSPSDQQVALYLEEHEPSLEHAVVTALEAGDSASPTLGHELVASALERAKKVHYGRRVEQSALYRFGGALTAVAVTAVLLTLAGPSHLKNGLSALLLPMTDAAAVNPYAVAVFPGDTTIARGTDQVVTAALSGFEAGDVSIFTRTGPDQSFQRLSMLSDDAGGFEALLLGVDDRTEYFVESTGIRSPTYTIDVADLPYVDQLDLTYYFPSYTGLQPRTREDGGDVAALPGTVVELKIHPTMITSGGQLLLDGDPAEELTTAEDGSLVARFTVSGRGFYSIKLARENGELVPASPEYTIDVLTDNQPSIQFTTPGRDVPASPIEEVYLEVRATDDYGIGDVRLVYSVNGGAEDTTSVFRNSGTPLPEVSTGYTLFLEEWELEPGDLISYYAVVRDNRGSAKSIESDMFFLNVRPFDIAFRQGEEQGGGGGGGGGGGEPEAALSELQRQIISATFNLIRQRDSYGENEFSENVVSVSLAQGRLMEQVGTLLERMQNRGLTETDPGFRDVSAILPLAVEAMTLAQTDLDTEELREALPDEQTALRYLQQAEETYERYVQQQQGGGGGGGGSQAAAEDLADLFELELDKLKNQYETVRRGEQQQSDDQVDALMEELQELARRQEQEAERQRRRAQQGQQGGSASAAESQRDLADQTEEAARQLQRLARENNDPQLEETARQLEQAAESMRQAASQGGASGTSEANSALRRLEDARRELEDARSERARRDAEDAIQRVDELQQQQREVQRRVRELPTSGEERTATINQLRERKDQMTQAVQDLERELDQSAAGSRADNPEAARALQDAAEQIRESKLKEKLQYSRGTIEQWDPQSAVTLELNIEADLQALRDRLEQAASISSQNETNPLEEALDAARELVRGMESMDRRLQETQQSQQGQEGQQGQGGEGQQGQGGEGQGQEGGQQQGGQGGGRAMNPAGGQNRGGGAVRSNPRPLTDEEIRQFRNEAGQRSDQARDLQNQLSQAGYSAEDLQAVVAAMNRLEREGTYSDPAQLRMLQQEILDMLKRLEFGLRRDVEGDADRGATLSGSDEVPDGYRKLVEEYYRALARGRSGGGGNN